MPPRQSPTLQPARWCMGAFLCGGRRGWRGCGGSRVPRRPRRPRRSRPSPGPGAGTGAGPGRCGIVPVVTGTGSHRAGLRPAPGPGAGRGGAPGPGGNARDAGCRPGDGGGPAAPAGAPGAAATSPRTAVGRPHRSGTGQPQLPRTSHSYPRPATTPANKIHRPGSRLRHAARLRPSCPGNMAVTRALGVSRGRHTPTPLVKRRYRKVSTGLRRDTR